VDGRRARSPARRLAQKRASEPASRYDYTPLLTVAAKAGLRLGELLGLEWPDCTLTKGAGVIEVRRQWTRLRETAPPKAGSRRSVPISDELVRMLLELKMAAPDKTGPVFASRTGTRLSPRNVEPTRRNAGTRKAKRLFIEQPRWGISRLRTQDRGCSYSFAPLPMMIPRWLPPSYDQKVQFGGQTCSTTSTGG
jgi:integrase